MRRAMAVPEGVEELLKMPAPALKTIADANPRSFPVQMALGTALRKAGQADEAMQAFERAAALVPIAGGTGQPARADGGDGAREEGSRARHHRADGAGRGRLQQRRGGAPARRPAAADRRRRSREADAGLSAHRRDRSVRSRGARDARALSRCSATRPTRRRASSAPSSRSARSTRRRRTPISARAISRAASARKRRSRRSRRSRSRPATSARRTCCSSWWT